MSVWLIPLFAITAIVYASVGFGGGSTYTAILALAETDHRVLPLVSLTCNLVVTAGSVWHFRRKGLYQGSKLVPILSLSVPASFLGGITPISADLFFGLLGILLLVAGTNLLLESATRSQSETVERREHPGIFLPGGVGLVIGYLSGLVGIGGGIFLAPLLHLLRWDSPKRIAAIASAYIAANSCAAFLGKLIALKSVSLATDTLSYWPLVLAVAAGGAIGRRLMTGTFPERAVKLGTAVLILLVAGRILLNWWSTHA